MEYVLVQGVIRSGSLMGFPFPADVSAESLEGALAAREESIQALLRENPQAHVEGGVSVQDGQAAPDKSVVWDVGGETVGRVLRILVQS